MFLSAGRLRNRITIQAPTHTPDGIGGQLTTWDDLTTVWAEVLPANGGESFRLGIERKSQFYRVTIRYRSDITAAHRLVWNDVAMNIRTCADPDGRREALLISAETGVADG